MGSSKRRVSLDSAHAGEQDATSLGSAQGSDTSRVFMPSDSVVEGPQHGKSMLQHTASRFVPRSISSVQSNSSDIAHRGASRMPVLYAPENGGSILGSDPSRVPMSTDTAMESMSRSVKHSSSTKPVVPQSFSSIQSSTRRAGDSVPASLGSVQDSDVDTLRVLMPSHTPKQPPLSPVVFQSMAEKLKKAWSRKGGSDVAKPGASRVPEQCIPTYEASVQNSEASQVPGSTDTATEGSKSAMLPSAEPFVPQSLGSVQSAERADSFATAQDSDSFALRSHAVPHVGSTQEILRVETPMPLGSASVKTGKDGEAPTRVFVPSDSLTETDSIHPPQHVSPSSSPEEATDAKELQPFGSVQNSEKIRSELLGSEGDSSSRFGPGPVGNPLGNGDRSPQGGNTAVFVPSDSVEGASYSCADATSASASSVWLRKQIAAQQQDEFEVPVSPSAVLGALKSERAVKGAAGVIVEGEQQPEVVGESKGVDVSTDVDVYPGDTGSSFGTRRGHSRHRFSQDMSSQFKTLKSTEGESGGVLSRTSHVQMNAVGPNLGLWAPPVQEEGEGAAEGGVKGVKNGVAAGGVNGNDQETGGVLLKTLSKEMLISRRLVGNGIESEEQAVSIGGVGVDTASEQLHADNHESSRHMRVGRAGGVIVTVNERGKSGKRFLGGKGEAEEDGYEEDEESDHGVNGAREHARSVKAPVNDVESQNQNQIVNQNQGEHELSDVLQDQIMIHKQHLSTPGVATKEDQPLSIGTAVHMAAAAVRSNLLHDQGFLYEDVHSSGTHTTYLSEEFTLKNFVAVLQINVGAIENFPSTGLVRTLFI